MLLIGPSFFLNGGILKVVEVVRKVVNVGTVAVVIMVVEVEGRNIRSSSSGSHRCNNISISFYQKVNVHYLHKHYLQNHDHCSCYQCPPSPAAMLLVAHTEKLHASLELVLDRNQSVCFCK